MLEKIRLKLEKIPSEYRRWSAFGVLLALLLALPITVWGLTSGRFEVGKRAVTSEVTPTPTLGPGKVRVYASKSTHPFGQPGIITLSLDNDSRNRINLIQLFMTFDPRVINFGGPDVELLMSGEATTKEVFFISGEKAQLRLIYPVNYDLGGGSIANIHYMPVNIGVTQLVFENDLKTGALENKVTAVGSEENLIKEIIGGSVTIVATPSPTSTPVCKTGLNSFSVYNFCPEGSRNARYVCYDGFSGTLGDPTSCKSYDVWRRYAEEACKGHSSCPTPTPQLGCRQPCSSDKNCAPGFKCGTPCPSGQLCAQYLFCYNPNCPYDADCTCPTPTPTLRPSPTLIPCVPEGQTMPVYPGYQCCPGLTAISTAKPDQYGNCPSQPPLGASVCAKCGNGICGLGENKCNCPKDCLALTPIITIIPTPTPTPTPRPTPSPTPGRCPGICLPRIFCRLIGGTCYSGFRCTGWRGISPCCCLRPKR